MWASFAIAVSLAQAAQIPLSYQPTPSSRNTLWRFDKALSSTNTTSNIIFDGVSSLLQQWANTNYRNGHNIVPATVPVGTLLYHGTRRQEIPTKPEWLATDPEHAYAFCRSEGASKGCWQLTLAVSRPLNVLYFDGSSAAKMAGSMDTQDMIAYDEILDDRGRIFDDWVRIVRLCEWGKKYNLDGFVRMEMDFEIMLCDFSQGLKLVSFSNLVPAFPDRHPSPRPPQPDANPPPPPSEEVGFMFSAFRIIESGHWHNYFPGETRVIPDLTRLLSFYDTELFPNLHVARHEQVRWKHRIGGVDKVEKQRALTKLGELLLSNPGTSGIDWSSIHRVVIHRYADRLEIVQYILNSTESGPESVAKTSREVYQYVESMLAPYILYGVQPPNKTPAGAPPFSWASPVFETCATTHTQFISDISLTNSEKLLLRSVNDVLQEICRVTVGIWAEGVELGLSKKPDTEDLQLSKSLTEKWGQAMDTLMAWLDWSVWVKCRPACSFEETCYLPTWPFFHRSGRLPLGPSQGDNSGHSSSSAPGRDPDEDDDQSWIRPQPRCMRRMAPFEIP